MTHTQPATRGRASHSGFFWNAPISPAPLPPVAGSDAGQQDD